LFALTPVLCGYWPRCIVALEGQHKGSENVAFLKVTPLLAKRERVVSIWLSV
jgi:hypothetical protein